MTEFGQHLRALFTNPLEVTIAAIVTHLPLAAGALAVLAAGWVVAALVRRLAGHLLRALGLDVILSRAGLAHTDDVEAPASRSLRPSRVLAQILYWALMFAALMAALDMLGLEAASHLLRGMAAWVPRLLLAIILFSLGLYVTDVLADAVEQVARSAKVPSARRIGLTLRLALLSLVTLTIMKELGIRVEGLVHVLLVGVGALAVTLALAFGLGGRQLGADLLAGQAIRTVLAQGQILTWEGQTATIGRMWATHTELQAGDRRFVIPNHQLASQVVELGPANRGGSAAQPPGQTEP
jgi:hypothetical protein